MSELLIGCGNNRDKKIASGARKDWSDLVTLDFDPNCSADVRHDLNELPYPFDDDEFEEIHAYCVLEHCGHQGGWRFFFDQWAEFWRITKNGGTFHGITPHHTSPWAWGDPSHTRIIGLECLSFLDQQHYEKHVGSTAMTDFRHYYKADWQLEHHQLLDDGQICFVLRARK